MSLLDAKQTAGSSCRSAAVAHQDRHRLKDQIIGHSESLQHVLDRLALRHQGRLTIVPLRQSVCRNMVLTTEAKLLALLTQWPEEQIVRVSDPLRVNARKALARMLKLK